MTLKELIEKLPLEVQDSFRLKVNEEISKTKVIDILGGRYSWAGDATFYRRGWIKEGYYPDKQDIDF